MDVDDLEMYFPSVLYGAGVLEDLTHFATLVGHLSLYHRGCLVTLRRALAAAGFGVYGPKVSVVIRREIVDEKMFWCDVYFSFFFLQMHFELDGPLYSRLLNLFNEVPMLWSPDVAFWWCGLLADLQLLVDPDYVVL